MSAMVISLQGGLQVVQIEIRPLELMVTQKLGLLNLLAVQNPRNFSQKSRVPDSFGFGQFRLPITLTA